MCDHFETLWNVGLNLTILSKQVIFKEFLIILKLYAL